jgi:mycothiol synthase
MAAFLLSLGWCRYTGLTRPDTARSISDAMAARPQLEMERTLLSDLLAGHVPPGYLVRAYRAGDEAAWCRLVREHIGGECTPERMRDELLVQPWFSADDLLFVETQAQVVGTACAQHPPDDAPVGHLHMLAVDSTHRGRGLGRALAVAALSRLSRLDCERAELRTDDFRLAAIRLYLSLGFELKITHESHPARWQDVYERLKLR